MLLAVAVVSISFTACSEDALSTNQFRGGVSLSAYGPQPVMRGGYLRFIGSNLDQIASVDINGADLITNIEVIKAGTPSEIRILVPEDGPEPGIVTLWTKSGEKICTKTSLSFEEPISVKLVTEKAMPGELIEIAGDYLNLIHMIEFQEGVWVSEKEFITHDRRTIKVVVPDNARTGKLNLYTADLVGAKDPDALTYNILPTDKALIIGTPGVTKFASPRGEAAVNGNVIIKQGETLTISGELFALVDSVKFRNDESKDSIYVNKIEVDEAGKTLKLVLPAEAPDGSVNLVTKSGVEIPVGTITTVAPSNCVAAPSPVKAGQPLTITGNDLDVVTSVLMNCEAGAEEVSVEFTYAGGKITVKAVPEIALEGNLKLEMANGKRTEVAFTLVKPAATAYDLNPANAGGALTITGTNLDLVMSVAFGEGVYTVADGDCSADGTTLKLTVPMDAKSGAPKLQLENGTEVTAPEITINEAVFCYVTEWPDEEHTPEAGGTMTVPVKNADHLTNVYVNDAAVQYVYNSKTGELIFGIPLKAKAKSVVRLVSDNGEIEYKDVAIIPAGKITTRIWTGQKALSWPGATVELPIGWMNAIPEGASAKFVVNYTGATDGATTKWYDGHWNENIIFPESDQSDPEHKVPLPVGGKSVELTITPEIIEHCKEFSDWGSNGLFHGQNAIIESVDLVVEVPQEINLVGGDIFMLNDASQPMAFPVALSWSDDACKFRIMRNGANDLQSMNLKAGKSKLIFYKQGTGQCQVNEPNWNWNETAADWGGSAATVELVLTERLIDCITGKISDGWGGTAFCVQGEGLTITKVTILP